MIWADGCCGWKRFPPPPIVTSIILLVFGWPPPSPPRFPQPLPHCHSASPSWPSPPVVLQLLPSFAFFLMLPCFDLQLPLYHRLNPRFSLLERTGGGGSNRMAYFIAANISIKFTRASHLPIYAHSPCAS